MSHKEEGEEGEDRQGLRERRGWRGVGQRQGRVGDRYRYR